MGSMAPMITIDDRLTSTKATRDQSFLSPSTSMLKTDLLLATVPFSSAKRGSLTDDRGVMVSSPVISEGPSSSDTDGAFSFSSEAEDADATPTWQTVVPRRSSEGDALSQPAAIATSAPKGLQVRQASGSVWRPRALTLVKKEADSSGSPPTQTRQLGEVDGSRSLEIPGTPSSQGKSASTRSSAVMAAAASAYRFQPSSPVPSSPQVSSRDRDFPQDRLHGHTVPIVGRGSRSASPSWAKQDLPLSITGENGGRRRELLLVSRNGPSSSSSSTSSLDVPFSARPRVTHSASQPTISLTQPSVTYRSASIPVLPPSVAFDTSVRKTSVTSSTDADTESASGQSSRRRSLGGSSSASAKRQSGLDGVANARTAAKQSPPANYSTSPRIKGLTLLESGDKRSPHQPLSPTVARIRSPATSPRSARSLRDSLEAARSGGGKDRAAASPKLSSSVPVSPSRGKRERLGDMPAPIQMSIKVPQSGTAPSLQTLPSPTSFSERRRKRKDAAMSMGLSMQSVATGGDSLAGSVGSPTKGTKGTPAPLALRAYYGADGILHSGSTSGPNSCSTLDPGAASSRPIFNLTRSSIVVTDPDAVESSTSKRASGLSDSSRLSVSSFMTAHGLPPREASHGSDDEEPRCTSGGSGSGRLPSQGASAVAAPSVSLAPPLGPPPDMPLPEPPGTAFYDFDVMQDEADDAGAANETGALTGVVADTAKVAASPARDVDVPVDEEMGDDVDVGNGEVERDGEEEMEWWMENGDETLRATSAAAEVLRSTDGVERLAEDESGRSALKTSTPAQTPTIGDDSGDLGESNERLSIVSRTTTATSVRSSTLTGSHGAFEFDGANVADVREVIDTKAAMVEEATTEGVAGEPLGPLARQQALAVEALRAAEQKETSESEQPAKSPAGAPQAPSRTSSLSRVAKAAATERAALRIQTACAAPADSGTPDGSPAATPSCSPAISTPSTASWGHANSPFATASLNLAPASPARSSTSSSKDFSNVNVIPPRPKLEFRTSIFKSESRSHVTPERVPVEVDPKAVQGDAVETSTEDRLIFAAGRSPRSSARLSGALSATSPTTLDNVAAISSSGQGMATRHQRDLSGRALPSPSMTIGRDVHQSSISPELGEMRSDAPKRPLPVPLTLVPPSPATSKFDSALSSPSTSIMITTPPSSTRSEMSSRWSSGSDSDDGAKTKKARSRRGSVGSKKSSRTSLATQGRAIPPALPSPSAYIAATAALTGPESPQATKKSFFSNFGSRKKAGSIAVPALNIGGLSPDHIPTSDGPNWTSPPSNLADIPLPDTNSAGIKSRSLSRDSSSSVSNRRMRASTVTNNDRVSITSPSPPTLRKKSSDMSLRVRRVGSDASLASTASKRGSTGSRRLSARKEDAEIEAERQLSALLSPSESNSPTSLELHRKGSDERTKTEQQQPPPRPPRPPPLRDIAPPIGLRAARSSIFPSRPKIDFANLADQSIFAPTHAPSPTSESAPVAVSSEGAESAPASAPLPPKTVRKRSATISSLQRMTRVSEAARVAGLVVDPRSPTASEMMGESVGLSQLPTPQVNTSVPSADGPDEAQGHVLKAQATSSSNTADGSPSEDNVVSSVLTSSPEQTPRIGYTVLHDGEDTGNDVVQDNGISSGGLGLAVTPSRRGPTPSRFFTAAEEEGLEALGKTLVHGRSGTVDSTEWPYATASTSSEASLSSPTAVTNDSMSVAASSTVDTDVGDVGEVDVMRQRVPRRFAKARKHRIARLTLGQHIRHPSLTDAGRQWVTTALSSAAKGAPSDAESGENSGSGSPFDTHAYYGEGSDGSTDYYGSSDGRGDDGRERGGGGGGGGRRGGNGRDDQGNGPGRGGNEQGKGLADEEDLSTEDSEDNYEADAQGARREIAAVTAEEDEDSDDVPLAQRVQDPEELQRKLREREARRDRANALRKAQAKAAPARSVDGRAGPRPKQAPPVLAAVSQSLDSAPISADDLTQRLMKVQVKRDAAAKAAQAARPPSSPRSAGHGHNHGFGLGLQGDTSSVQTHESGGSIRDSSMSRARSLHNAAGKASYRTAPSPHKVSPVGRVVPLPSSGASPTMGLVPLPGGMPSHQFPYAAAMGAMPHVSPLLMQGPMGTQMMPSQMSPMMSQVPTFDAARAFAQQQNQQRTDSMSIPNSSPSKSTVPLPSSTALQSRSRSQSLSRPRASDGRPAGLNGTAPPLPDLQMAQYGVHQSSHPSSSPMPSSGGHVPTAATSAHGHAERHADRQGSNPPSSDPYSPTSSAPRSSTAVRSTAMEIPLQEPISPVQNSQFIQHRVYIVTRQRYGTAEVATTARARGLVLDILHKEHVPPSDGKGGGWVVFDVSVDLGIERPLREYEVVSEVAASRANSEEDYFMLKRTELAPYLSIRAVPTSSPVLAGWVYVQEAKGKWNKRWLELREHSLYHAKSEKGKNEVQVCHLSGFDVYLADSAKIKAPKALSFAVRSQHSITLFEKPDQDYVHYFALSDPAAHRSWVRAIMNARTYVLRQERGALFRAPTGPQRATEDTQSHAQSQPSSSSVSRGPNPFTSNAPAQPQQQQPLIHRAGPTAAAIAAAQPFEKGSLLASQAADAAPLDLSIHERTRARMQEEARWNEMRERMARARNDGAPLVDPRR